MSAALVFAALSGGCSTQAPQVRSTPGLAPIARVNAERDDAAREMWMLEQKRLRRPEDDALFTDTAASAWRWINDHFERSGLVAPVKDYAYATMWDIGSMLGAVYCAHELGLIDDAGYAARMHDMLHTLKHAALFDDRAFGRSYDTRTAALVRSQRDGARVVGWSAIDAGRFLTWLRIVSIDPQFSAEARAVAERIDFSSLVERGYMWGANLDATGKTVRYQEGRIGYEQYAATGYALWGHPPDKALNVMENATPIEVGGQALVADVRRWDRLTPEPFLLLGMEVGWNRPIASLTRRMLLAQQARYRATGHVTIGGEDAVAEPPHYFYYYCLYSNGKQYAIDVQDRRASVDGPRWISAKSAFALHALMPSEYTKVALTQLRRAETPDGWSSGVYEQTGASTDTPNVNTSAVILTAAVVHKFGEPVLAHAQRVNRR